MSPRSRRALPAHGAGADGWRSGDSATPVVVGKTTSLGRDALKDVIHEGVLKKPDRDFSLFVGERSEIVVDSADFRPERFHGVIFGHGQVV